MKLAAEIANIYGTMKEIGVNRKYEIIAAGIVVELETILYVKAFFLEYPERINIPKSPVS